MKLIWCEKGTNDYDTSNVRRMFLKNCEALRWNITKKLWIQNMLTKIHIQLLRFRQPFLSKIEQKILIEHSTEQVNESEIGVRPYITDSEQKLLDEKNEETLHRYRELMANDFPDRALNIMMNGVLEQK